MSGLWDQLIDAVCRPPRDDAYTEKDLIGGQRASFRLGHARYYRQDLVLQNDRGENLACSHFRPCVVASQDGRLPTVIYCHCNSGSRRDAEEIVYHFLPKHVTVFSLDFAGSGWSQGSWVTLGARESLDIATVVQYLREEGSASTVGLWGRSMGSVAALLHASRDPGIAGLVLDSPFSRLRDLMLELAASDPGLRVPAALTRVALALLKRSVRRRAGFSIDDVAPVDRAASIFCPAMFGAGRDDSFVSPQHSRRLAAAYGGEARLRIFDGDHNSVRPDDFYEEAVAFMLRALRVEELLGFDVLLVDPAAAAKRIAGAQATAAGQASPGGDANGEDPAEDQDQDDADLAMALALSMEDTCPSREGVRTASATEAAQLALALELSLRSPAAGEVCPAAGARDAETESQEEEEAAAAADPPHSPKATFAQRNVAQHARQEEDAVARAVAK